MTTPALLCRQLIKTFDGTRALDGLELSVEPGTIFGLLGPNGSGKTTTIRTSLGIYKPDGGSVQLLGSSDPLAVRRQTGYLPEERGLYARMKLHEQLRSSLRFGGCPPRSLRVAPRRGSTASGSALVRSRSRASCRKATSRRCSLPPP